MKRFDLTELQANAILDTRLRSLRKLEEMELKREHAELTAEKAQIEALLGSDAKQWKTIAWEIRQVLKKFGPETALGKRRTTFADAPEIGAIDITDALVEKEPITIVISEKGWIRALKGHVGDLSNVAFKGDDGLKLAFRGQTTDKLLVLATNGKVFTLEAAKLPGGRGFGDPIRLMADIDPDADIVTVWPHEPGAKRLIIGRDARGFVVASDDLVANTRKGKNVLTVDSARAWLSVPVEGDGVAIIGENRKLLVFPLDQIPEMARGKGVRLQRYKEGGIADAKTFSLAEGLTFTDSAGRTFTVKGKDLDEWRGNRAEAGKLPPKGFPKTNRFVG